MGRYSGSDEESSRKSKRKRKKRSRSRSRSASSGGSRYSHNRTKHRKSKKKNRRRSRSRSRSSQRHIRRDRSPGRRRRSRSSDRSRRSRSYDRGQRSRSVDRSYDRNRRSRSYTRRSRSDSRDRSYSQKHSTSRDRVRRSRSDSRSKSHSRRSSQERRKEKHSLSPSQVLVISESNTMDSIPGFYDMTPAEQAHARMKRALRAAAVADEKLKEQSTSSPSARSLSPMNRQEFAEAVASIESDSFSPATFRSSRASKAFKDTGDIGELSWHHMAMFGAVGSSVVFTKAEPMERNQTALEENPETLFDSSLNVDPAEKLQRWIQKLSAMRRRRMEGIMTFVN